ncbi:MFS transporter [Isoptericola sp. b441]|uniref:MFS transporter n=1 Tax=Actinotalea lenta TaxID=3064654 RepID=A0ABT9DAE9_9CELL|nr:MULTISPECIES: MFS transporter [unclassified Isoptericola]MDO8107884.1 MFS transporter [Isoptericola sp. b441]
MAPAPVPRRRVLSWALWDWGSAAFNAVITTFVFTVWLTSSAFVDPAVVAAADGAPDGSAAAQALDDAIALHSEWLGWGIGLAGVVIALLAPVAGSRSDDSGHRKRWLGVHTGVVVLVSAAMFLVRPAADALTANLLAGIALLAVGNVFFELAAVNYNATLTQVSTPRNVGRVSGFGWGMGYIGGIVLLALLFVGFIAPEVGWFGVTSADGLNIRAAVLTAAVWFGVFAVPVLVAVPEAPPSAARARDSFWQAYRRLFSDIAGLWRTARHTLRFLIASAVFRDGLAGVFTFGAVIASGTFGFSTDQVLIFAIAANLVAGLSTITSGWFDDRFGPKAVIVAALVGLLISGTAIFGLHAGGKTVFWVLGLMLSAFVGPAQTASRTMLARVIPPGRESEIFGLYATTGRAASFIAPVAFSAFIAFGGAQYWGIVGIMLVLALGLALLLPVRLARTS